MAAVIPSNSLLTSTLDYQFRILHTPMAKRSSLMEEGTFEHIEDIDDISLGKQDSGLVEILNQIPPPESKLLSLPLEIRLQIYRHLMDIHPTSNCHLAPNPAEIGSSPQADIPSYFIHQRGRSIPSSFYPSSSSLTPPKNSPERIPHSASRCLYLPKIHKLPTSLLLSSKKIYFESRAIPFQTNNWVFVNWFNSGLYAATTFIKATKKWQRESIRFVGLEVGGVELVGCKGGCVSEWEEICGFLGGGGAVWGLRVVVRGRCGGYGALINSPPIDMHGEQNVGREKKIFIEKSVLDARAKWVTEGLCQLTSLRHLDVTIADPDCSVEERDAFRRELEMLMGGVEVRVEGLGGVGMGGDGDADGEIVVEEVEDVNPFGQMYPGLWGGF